MEVFVKGYLRAYARAIGADGDEVIRRYEASLESLREASLYDEAISRSRRSFWKRFLILILLLIVLIVLSMGAVFFFQQTRYNRGSRQTEGVDSPKADTAPEANSPKAAERELSDKSPAKAVPDLAADQERAYQQHILQVRANHATWVKVIVDGGKARRYNLNKDDHLVLEAKKDFNLLIGDARGVDLTINDTPYKILGKKGQVVTVQLP